MKSKTQTDIDGQIWIDNGKVVIQREKGDGLPPIINPCEGVKLIINNIECNHLTAISENDTVELQPQESTKESQLDIAASDDNMFAYLEYYPECKIIYKLKDTTPKNKLDIITEKIISEKIPIIENTILSLLKNLGISYGINYDAINEIISGNEPGNYLIAKGKETKPTKDEYIEYYFEENEERKLTLKEDSHGKVDFKNIFEYNDVKAGDMIAKIFPPVPGSPGCNIFGEEISITEPKLITIIENSVTIYDKEKNIIISKKSGRPTKIIQNNTVMFNIIDKIVVEDVTLETGNIKYNGDIEVKGSVHESLEVISKKNVTIHGGVSFAKIQAGNNINIKESLISSTIFAAKNLSFGKNPSPEINKALSTIENLIYNIENFKEVTSQTLDFENFYEKIFFLLNNNNKNLPKVIYEIVRNLKNGTFDIEKEDFMNFMKTTRILLGNYFEIDSIEKLKHIAETLKLMCLANDTSIITGTVHINYALNSNINALGDVYIFGKGASNTKIITDGNVHITGNFRGGEIYAKKNVFINSSGVESGVKTLISVPITSSIKINTANSETVLKFGVHSHRFLNNMTNINAKCTKNKISF